MSSSTVLYFIVSIQLFAVRHCLLLTKTEQFSQSVSHLSGNFNITKLPLQNHISNFTSRLQGINLCFTYPSCFAVSDPYSGHILFAGFDPVPGVGISHSYITNEITWNAMQSLQGETTTNYALYADTFSSEGGWFLDLAVDEIMCRHAEVNSNCGGCAFVTANDNMETWWAVHLHKKVIVTKVEYTSSSGRDNFNVQQFVIQLSLENANPHVSTDLVECGSGLTSGANSDGIIEVQCIQPKRSLYVILQQDGENALKVCDFRVFSLLSPYFS